MIIVTYKQWFDGNRYARGYYNEYTSTYDDKSKLLEYMKQCEEEGNPIVIMGIWELS